MDLVEMLKLDWQVSDISEKNEFVPREIWLEVSSRSIKGAVLPIFKEWILGELNLEIQECNAVNNIKNISLCFFISEASLRCSIIPEAYMQDAR